MCMLDCLLVSAIIFYMYKAKIWMGVVTSLQWAVSEPAVNRQLRQPSERISFSDNCLGTQRPALTPAGRRGRAGRHDFSADRPSCVGVVESVQFCLYKNEWQPHSDASDLAFADHCARL